MDYKDLNLLIDNGYIDVLFLLPRSMQAVSYSGNLDCDVKTASQ